MDWIVFLTKHLDHIVLGVLGVMSFLVVAFSIERYIYYKRVCLNQFQCIELLHSDLTNNLTMISSVAVNAPYVGLLGTIIGILLTFNAMSDGNIDASSIMVGLAMALKATAFGLLVAIPAVLFYNGLMRKVDVLVAKWSAEHKQHRA